jgi:glycosyltransferase involved in cell wall biosynthesis
MEPDPVTSGPVVTVVLPVFNGAATLARTLGSVLRQTLRDLEVLVVDDGSSDDSFEIADRIDDTRVRCLRHENNLGAAAARNTGILAATGRYIAFIDADDEWLPDKLAKQYRYLSDAQPGMAAVCTGFIMQRHGQSSGRVRIPMARKGWGREMLDVCAVAPGTTLMVERRIFDAIGLLNTALVRFEDWDWLLRYLMRYDLGVVPEPLAIVHSSPFRGIEAVDDSARMLLLRQKGNVRQIAGPWGLRTFKASLWLERAIVHWRVGRRGSALLYVGNALFLSPARLVRLAMRGMRKIAEGDI